MGHQSNTWDMNRRLFREPVLRFTRVGFTMENLDWQKILKQSALGAGLLLAGYQIGRYSSRRTFKDVVSKSFKTNDADWAVMQYCLDHSSPLTAVQERLIQETLDHARGIMMGAPEVVNLNAGLLKAIGAKKVIDVGVFTGASSLAAALALPGDGLVMALDVSEEFTNIAQKYWQEAGVNQKILLKLAPATESLQDLIDQGQSGTFDFAFIDADKANYVNYYHLCSRLLRKGGIMVFDNTLWFGAAPDPRDTEQSTLDIRQVNDTIRTDAQSGKVHAIQMNVGDGLTLVVKLE
eukprot:maker-scaffold330_size203968-snap-gene-0.16 protein:Tk05060 transcript:maker-scaffold330_size203968-snap-gene-0.16-mRNA-1 annotation:"O-methyltransferase"